MKKQFKNYNELSKYEDSFNEKFESEHEDLGPFGIISDECFDAYEQQLVNDGYDLDHLLQSYEDYNFKGHKNCNQMRLIRDANGDFIGCYTVCDEAEREILINGIKVPSNTIFPNIETLIDDFEDGFNKINNEYEYLSYNKFTVRRKIKNIHYFQHSLFFVQGQDEYGPTGTIFIKAENKYAGFKLVGWDGYDENGIRIKRCCNGDFSLCLFDCFEFTEGGDKVTTIYKNIIKTLVIAEMKLYDREDYHYLNSSYYDYILDLDKTLDNVIVEIKKYGEEE